MLAALVTNFRFSENTARIVPIFNCYNVTILLNIYRAIDTSTEEDVIQFAITVKQLMYFIEFKQTVINCIYNILHLQL